MSSPIGYDEISTMQNNENLIMIHDTKTMISSQECVEQITKMLPMIFQPKDRPKIQDPKKIQDTDDVVQERDTGGMENKDTLPQERKVRWKDLEKDEQKKDAR